MRRFTVRKPRTWQIVVLAVGCELFAIGVGLSFVPGVGRAFRSLGSYARGTPLEEGLAVVSGVTMCCGGPLLMLVGAAGVFRYSRGGRRVTCPDCGHSNSRHRTTCKACRANLAEALARQRSDSEGLVEVQQKQYERWRKEVGDG